MSVIDEVREKALERDRKWTTIVCDTFPPLKSVNEPAYCGVCVRSLLKSRIRYISRDSVVRPFGVDQSYTDVARDYLDIKFPNRLRAYKEQRDELVKKRIAPHYAKKGLYESMIYFDLSAAYASIMGVTGWDCDYWPSKFLSPGTVPTDFPLMKHKAARLCLVSSGIAMKARYWNGEKLTVKTIANKHINFGLWSCVIDTLNLIAQKALMLGAVYVNTDGCILPFDNAHILSDYVGLLGLSWRHKGAGNAVVFSQQSYAIGTRRTKSRGVQRVAIVDNVDYSDFSNLEGHLIRINEWRQKTGIMSRGGVKERYLNRLTTTRNLASFGL